MKIVVAWHLVRQYSMLTYTIGSVNWITTHGTIKDGASLMAKGWSGCGRIYLLWLVLYAMPLGTTAWLQYRIVLNSTMKGESLD
jgi:hypothetical protein